MVSRLFFVAYSADYLFGKRMVYADLNHLVHHWSMDHHQHLVSIVEYHFVEVDSTMNWVAVLSCTRSPSHTGADAKSVRNVVSYWRQATPIHLWGTRRGSAR